ncbi:MAG: hypothetical protein ACYC9O_01690 [Candidatus Latescibacterota bacterium]
MGWYFKLMTEKIILAIAVFTIINIVFAGIRLVRLRKGMQHNGLAWQIDAILALAALMPLTACISPFTEMIRAMRSIATAATGDPKIIVYGLIQTFYPIFIALALFFIFLEVWIILRGLYRSQRQQTVELPNHHN